MNCEVVQRTYTMYVARLAFNNPENKSVMLHPFGGNKQYLRGDCGKSEEKPFLCTGTGFLSVHSSWSCDTGIVGGKCAHADMRYIVHVHVVHSLWVFNTYESSYFNYIKTEPVHIQSCF